MKALNYLRVTFHRKLGGAQFQRQLQAAYKAFIFSLIGCLPAATKPCKVAMEPALWLCIAAVACGIYLSM